MCSTLAIPPMIGICACNMIPIAKILAKVVLSMLLSYCMELLPTIIYLSRCATLPSGFVSLSEYTSRTTFHSFLFGEWLEKTIISITFCKTPHGGLPGIHCACNVLRFSTGVLVRRSARRNRIILTRLL